MNVDERASIPQPIIGRRCPKCGTFMTPARYNPRTGVAERLCLPGPFGGMAIRLICENGHLSVFRMRDLSTSDKGDAE